MTISEEQVIAHIEAHVDNINDATEKLHPGKLVSKREMAERRWQIYILVLSGDALRGFVALLKAKEYRCAIILARTIFEYRLKSEYLLKNRKEAYRQYRLIPCRVHADLSRLSPSDPTDAAELVNFYLEWRRTAGTLADDHMGDIGASKMSLAIAEDKQTDSEGNEYSPEFIHKYGIPSWTVHADAAGVAEVFPGWNNDRDWTIRKGAVLFDHFSALALEVLHTVFDHLRTVRIHYNLDFEPLQRLAMRSLEIRRMILREWREQDPRS